MGCVFCSIIKGDLPCEKVYEDKDVLAFLSIDPVKKGHTLLVPKKHVVNILDMDKKTAQSLFEATRKLSPLILLATKADGLNVSMNNNPASGQEVMHAHMHVIPRYKEDHLDTWPHEKYTSGELKAWAEKIRNVESASSKSM
jgi:histidine triad (HIT) family protein